MSDRDATPARPASPLRGLHFARGLVYLLLGNLVAGAVLFALFVTRVSHAGTGGTGVHYVPMGLAFAIGVTAGLMALTRERRLANVTLGAVMAVVAWLLVEVVRSVIRH